MTPAQPGDQVLVTGFEAFGEHERNPSAGVARALGAEAGVRAEVLPVAYGPAEQRLREIFDEQAPRAVLMFGLHVRPELALERVARNVDDEPATDAEGVVRRRQPIRPHGPAAYWSTLPLGAFADALGKLGVPLVWSDDAGGFLCNHVFYLARHLATERGWELPAGFVHLPPDGFLPLPTQVIAARACLDALVESLEVSVPAPG